MKKETDFFDYQTKILRNCVLQLITNYSNIIKIAFN
jgi:hypothetical protein